MTSTNQKPPTCPRAISNSERFPRYRAVSVVVNQIRVERGLDDDLSDLDVFCDPQFVYAEEREEGDRNFAWGTCYRDGDGRLHLCEGANGNGKHLIVEATNA